MSSPDEPRSSDRVNALRAQILATAEDAPETLMEVASDSVDAHFRSISTTEPIRATEVIVRVLGDGVHGHLVAVDDASPLLSEIQKTVTWIGSRVRREFEKSKALKKAPVVKDKRGVREATRMFFQPQFGAGSLIFHLTSIEPVENTAALVPATATESILDLSVQELITIFGAAEKDSAGAIGDLTTSVRRMGPQAASSLKRLADGMVKNDLDIDLTWRGASGGRKSTKVRRRGALAIRDAVDRNREKTEVVNIVGLLETVSTGKDPIRIETGDGSVYKMGVDPALGMRLGSLLHARVAARAEETTTWHDSGLETKRYVLISAEPELTIPSLGADGADLTLDADRPD